MASIDCNQYLLYSDPLFLSSLLKDRSHNHTCCQGAKASALYYSLVETCKRMKVDPQKYFTYLFSHAASCTTDNDWDAMLPYKVNLSSIDDYYDTLRKATADPDRKDPYILRGKKK